MEETCFVTGATGNVGREVVKHLLLAGHRVIAAKRPQKTITGSRNLTYRDFDFTDSKTWESCLQGVTKVFLMRPPHISKIKRDMYPFMKFLKHRGIKHVVFLSVQGVENNTIIPHHKVEMLLKELEIPHTFVRPSFFMQNLTTTHLAEIRDDRMVFVPTGSGKTNFIDVRDIGEIISYMFLDERHLNKAYTVTGDQSYSYREVADHLSRGLGTNIRFVNPNPVRFLYYHLKHGRTLGMTLVMLVLYLVVKRGLGDITTTTSEEILGRKPRSLDTFIEDHRALLLGTQ
ncbi:MAG: NmrA family NAD(P)-binding protein [Spirochaetota bacterium]